MLLEYRIAAASGASAGLPQCLEKADMPDIVVVAIIAKVAVAAKIMPLAIVAELSLAGYRLQLWSKVAVESSSPVA